MYGTMSLRNEARRGRHSALQGRNTKSAPNFCKWHIQVSGTVVICCFGVMCNACWKLQNSQITSTGTALQTSDIFS